FSGLSKAYRIAGYRSGWLAITGPLAEAHSYLEGIKLLANMRMCSNVPAQHAIQAALGGKQSIEDLVLPTGRLGAQMELAHEGLNSIDGVSAHRADGALYMFAKLDVEKFGITDDEQFALDLLREQKILVSHGTAFNWPNPAHLRLVTLPSVEALSVATDRHLPVRISAGREDHLRAARRARDRLGAGLCCGVGLRRGRLRNERGGRSETGRLRIARRALGEPGRPRSGPAEPKPGDP